MPRKIVIAGGGVAALEAAVALRTLGGDSVAPVVVAPNLEFSFRAREVGDPFGKPPSLRIPVEDVLHELSIPLRRDRLLRVDPAEQLIYTVDGLELPYQGLLVAIGGTPYPAFAHGIVFDRAEEPARFDELLVDIEQGLVCDVAFVVPDAAGWTLPAYDLALILRSWARRNAIDLAIRLVTAEAAPLECFGSAASGEVGRVLQRADIALACGAEPILVSDTTMTAGGHWISVDRIVSLPRVAGPRIPGLPCDADGFLSVVLDGAVPNCPGVYGAGDGTAHRQKQGGLAAQQADRAGRALLREAGLRVPQPPERPTLRGALATPDGPLFLEASPGDSTAGATSIATLQPLWDPAGKVATRWLGPFLEGMTQRQLTAFAS